MCSEHRAAGCHIMVILVLLLTLSPVLSTLLSLQVVCYRCGYQIKSASTRFKRHSSSTSSHVTQWQNWFLMEFMEAKNLDRSKTTVIETKKLNITVKHKDIIFGSSPYRPTLLEESLKEEYSMHVIFDTVFPLASATRQMDFWSNPVQLSSCSKCFMLGNFTAFFN